MTIEKQLFQAADKMRGAMDAGEYQWEAARSGCSATESLPRAAFLPHGCPAPDSADLASSGLSVPLRRDGPSGVPEGPYPVSRPGLESSIDFSRRFDPVTGQPIGQLPKRGRLTRLESSSAPIEHTR
jgi:hypothetical protein